jgi:site-specific recombinase XerD
MSSKKGRKIESGIWQHSSDKGYVAEVSVVDPRTGRRLRERKTIHRLDMAREWRQTRKADAIRGEIRRDSDRPEPVRFEVFAERYLEQWSKVKKAESSYVRDKNSLKHLVGSLKGKYLSEIQRVHVDAYVAKRKKSGGAAGTLNRELSCLKNMLRKATDWEIIESNPAAGVSKEREEVPEFEWLTEDEAEKLIEACPENLKLIITVALNTGLRRGELFNLTWTDVDFEQGILTVRQTKNGDTRYIPMNQKVLRALSAHSRFGRRIVGGKVCQWVFSSASGEKLKSFRNGLDAALQRAGIRKHIRPHDLRHSFASHLVMKGVDLRTVAQLLGHRDLRVTMRYTHLAPDHLRAAIGTLGVG